MNKSLSIRIVAGLLTASVLTGTSLVEIHAEDTQPVQEQMETSSESTLQATSKVKVIHAAVQEGTEAPSETQQGNEEQKVKYEPKKWWKAGIGEYQDAFSLVRYENADGTKLINGARIIAEGRDDSVTVSMSPQSAVYDIQAGQFAFTSYGWGHGVGMSQNGANFYAKYGGWNYQDILFHYYPGTTLINTGTAETEIVTVDGVPGNVLMQVSEIVNREIGPSFEPECIKAQAVAIYTYIKYHGDDAHDLLGKPDPPQSLIDLCASVLGEALVYNGDFANTMFGASSGGITANCYDVFEADLPYLRSVISAYDEAYDPYWGEVKYFTIDEMRYFLQSTYGVSLSSDPSNWIRLIEGNGGYIHSVVIDDQITVRGYPFSCELGLRTSKFTYICSSPAEESDSYFDDVPYVEYVEEEYDDSEYDEYDYDEYDEESYE